MGLLYIIGNDDTLRSIAQKELGDIRQWMRIALLNDLEYPYIGVKGQTYTGNVKLPGESIVLPTTDTHVEEEAYFAARNQIDNLDYAELFLGIDIAVEDGEIFLAGSPDGYDLLAVSGVDNFKQAIYHRFATRRGGLKYYPEYGSRVHDYIGSVLERRSLEFVKAEMVKTAMQDPRTSNVVSASVKVDDKSPDRVHGIVVIETVTGLSATIDTPLNKKILGA